VKLRKKSGRQKAPWRNSTAVQNMKRMQKSRGLVAEDKTLVYYKIYKDSIHALGKARQTFFSNIRNSNLNNTRTLFLLL